jgi:hypothetical protein
MRLILRYTNYRQRPFEFSQAECTMYAGRIVTSAEGFIIDQQHIQTDVRAHLAHILMNTPPGADLQITMRILKPDEKREPVYIPDSNIPGLEVE